MISPATVFSSKDEGVGRIMTSRRLSEDLDRLLKRNSNPDVPYVNLSDMDGDQPRDDGNSTPSTTTSNRNVMPGFTSDHSDTPRKEKSPPEALFEKQPVPQSRSMTRWISDESKHSVESDKGNPSGPSPGQSSQKQSFLSVSIANQRSKSRSPDGSIDGTHTRAPSNGSGGGNDRNKLKVIIMDVMWMQDFEIELRGYPTVAQTIDQIIFEYRALGQEATNVLSGWRSDQYDLYMLDEDDEIDTDFPALPRSSDLLCMDLDGVAMVLRDEVKMEIEKMLSTRSSAPPSPNPNINPNNLMSDLPGMHHHQSSSISSFDVGESTHSSFLSGHSTNVGPGPANWAYKEYIVKDMYDSKKPECRIGIDKDRILCCVSKKNKSYKGAVSATSMLPHWVYVFLSPTQSLDEETSQDDPRRLNSLFELEQFLNEREQQQQQQQQQSDPQSTSPSKSPQQSISPKTSPAPTPEPPTLPDQEFWDDRLRVILKEDEKLESANEDLFETHRNNRWIDANVVTNQRNYLLRKLVEKSTQPPKREKTKTPKSDLSRSRSDTIDPTLVRQSPSGRPRKASMFSFSIGWSSRMHARRDSLHRSTRSSRASSRESSQSVSSPTSSAGGRRRGSSIPIFQPLTIEGLDKVSVSKTDTRIFEITFILYENEYEFADDDSEDEKQRDELSKSGNRLGDSMSQLNLWDVPSGESAGGFDSFASSSNLKKSMSARQLTYEKSGGAFETHSCRYQAKTEEDCAEIVSRIGHLMYIERVEEEKNHHFYVNSKRHLEQLRLRLIQQYKWDKEQMMLNARRSVSPMPSTNLTGNQQIGFRVTMDDTMPYDLKNDERLYLRIDASS